MKKLRAFRKVMLEIGDKKRVEFTLGDQDFSYIDADMKTVKNKGEHKIMVGNLECSVNI